MHSHLFCSVLVNFYFSIYLTEACVMHESGYVYFIRSTKYHFPFWYSTSVHFIICEAILAIERKYYPH